MAMFNSYVKLPESSSFILRVSKQVSTLFILSTFSHRNPNKTRRHPKCHEKVTVCVVTVTVVAVSVEVVRVVVVKGVLVLMVVVVAVVVVAVVVVAVVTVAVDEPRGTEILRFVNPWFRRWLLKIRVSIFPFKWLVWGYTGYTALTHPETSHCFYSWWPGKSRSSPSRCHCIPPLLLSKTVCENMADRHERVAYPHFLMPRSLSSHHPPEPHPTKCPFSPLLVRQIQGGFLVLLCPFFLLVKSPHIHIFLILSPSSIAKKSPIHFVKVSSSQNPHDISGLVAETPSWLSSGSLWHPYWLLIFVPWYSQSVLWSAPCQPNLGYQLMINDVSSLFFKLLKIV